MLYIAGLGPGDASLITIETFSLLRETRVILRTGIHPAAEQLGEWDISFETMDRFYEEDRDFESVYKDIAEEVLKIYREGEGDLTFCVPGNPMMAERSVRYIIKTMEETGEEYTVKPALSFVDTLITSLEIDPVEGLTVLDALDLKDKTLTGETGYVITQVYNRRVAGDVKIELSKFMDDEAEIYFVKAAGVSGENITEKIKLYELDRREDVDHLTSLYIDGRQIKKSFGDFKKTVDILREPGGCPWDREQTNESLKRYLIEESYEVLDAIDRNDDELLMEELGDVLLQVMLHSRIKEEERIFDVYDVIRSVNDKMISRHPHVFGDMNLGTSEEVLNTWEKLKKKEDGEISLSAKLSKIPMGIPAAIRAAETVKKAKAYGIEPETEEELKKKLLETINNIYEKGGNKDELSDLIYLAVLLTDSMEINPELLLNDRVNRRIGELSEADNK